jgi:hypothetical protein
MADERDSSLAMRRDSKSARSWRYPGSDPDEFAASCIESAAEYGFVLVVRPDTPVIPDEVHPWFTTRGTWADIDILAREWAEVGCRWINLRFGLDEDGAAVVRYEGQPDQGGPYRKGYYPWLNGGFDVHRLLPHEEWSAQIRDHGT